MSNNFPGDLLQRLAVNHNHHHLPMAPKVEQPEAEEELELRVKKIKRTSLIFEYVNQLLLHAEKIRLENWPPHFFAFLVNLAKKC
ncbi:tRNA uridine-5-carboxymethylaminomethy [Sesbania bispinosa]|nr:tRNA uridine-5-carboxymethylaminomethy [Sesbania bispinosa]